MMHLAWNLPAVEEVQLAGIRARNRNGGVIVWPWERAGWRRCYSDNFSAVRRWSNGGMILTGENSSTGGKTLYSVGGRWMNEYGAMVEWYWQGKTEVLGEKTLYSVGGRWINEYGAMVEWYWQGKTEVLGEKTLYSVGGRWVNEYGAMVEWYWQGKTEVLGEKHYTAWVVDGWMSMEQWWNGTDRGKLKYWEKNIIQCGW